MWWVSGCRCLERPETLDPPGAELIGVCDPPDVCVLEIKPRSSGRAICALTAEPSLQRVSLQFDGNNSVI